VIKSLVTTLSAFSQPLDLQLLSSLEKSRQLLLGHVHLPGIHELQNGCQVGERDVLQDDDGVLGRVLLKEVLEVGRACTEDHLVCLGVLTLGSNGDIAETFFIPQVFEGCNHVGLEVVPSEAELLVVSHG